MSKVKSQDKHITIGTPVEIDSAVNQIRLLLANMSWVSHPFSLRKDSLKMKRVKNTCILKRIARMQLQTRQENILITG